MPPVPLWRLAPFRVPASFDVNLCTDSVLPGTVAPVRLRCAWVLWPLLSRIPCKFQLSEYRMGPFPTHASQRNSSILTGLLASLAGFAPLRGLHLVVRPRKLPGRKPRRSAPRTHCLRQMFRRLSWDFARTCAPRASPATDGTARTLRRTSVIPKPPYASRIILVHEAAHTDVHHDAQRQKRKQDRRSPITHQWKRDTRHGHEPHNHPHVD
jgi:hypothetical protein